MLFHIQQQPQEAEREKKLRLTAAVTELLKTDIRSVTQTKDNWPTNQEMATEDQTTKFLPESLELLLQPLFVGNKRLLRVSSSGQAIMEA